MLSEWTFFTSKDAYTSTVPPLPTNFILHTHPNYKHTPTPGELSPRVRTLYNFSYRSTQRTSPSKSPVHRHTILFVLIILAHHGWQVRCPFTHRLRGEESADMDTCPMNFSSGDGNLLTPPTVSGGNLDKEVKLNANNFLCALELQPSVNISCLLLCLPYLFVVWPENQGSGEHEVSITS